ncbi:metallophosphoesterase [Agrococcus sp. HG114]|uniref:metallophosphoesterase family protein n=1 Tax=Agrococcus sp. HG114 TaxID=2969757 RepID=UPI00215AEC39|nr:metallophosphoesterase [Agrococcus sp. HG114]MCR8672006.1 metallophosphoesterase [Agrococcus sp. HG114]
MPTRLLLLSDTHLPVRAKALQEQVWRLVDEADAVVHAGDWVSSSFLDELGARAARLIGVAGNNDGPELHARLGEVARVELEGVRIAVVHQTGAAAGRERRCDARFGPGSDAPSDVLVFGHSHIPWDSTTQGGLRLLNPGSPTDRRRQSVGTVVTAVADGGALRDVRLIPTPR